MNFLEYSIGELIDLGPGSYSVNVLKNYPIELLRRLIAATKPYDILDLYCIVFEKMYCDQAFKKHYIDEN